MARTHKTALIKQQMADRAREEEEARTAEAVRRASVEEARTRAEKSRAMEIGREEEDDDADISAESGPHVATTDDTTDVNATETQQGEKEEEREDEESEENSAWEEEKDELVHEETRGRKKRPAPDCGDEDDAEADDVAVPSF
ncbi:hypothetical protein PInf_001483 [Phytophthora infestans]|nr:hypothetical protein PInf_001483 [Phytophthora infestans]